MANDYADKNPLNVEIMKSQVYEKFMGLKDYSPCMRYVDGTLVDPVAYRRWLIENNVKQLNN